MAVRIASARARRFNLMLRECAVPTHADGGDIRFTDPAVLDGNELGDDADGDFLRSDSADVETDRRVDALERFSSDSVLDECVEDAFDLRLAAYEAAIAQRPRCYRPHGVEVVGMTPGHNHGVRGGRKLGFLQPRRDVVDNDLDVFTEPLAVCELLAIVDDVHVEA